MFLSLQQNTFHSIILSIKRKSKEVHPVLSVSLSLLRRDSLAFSCCWGSDDTKAPPPLVADWLITRVFRWTPEEPGISHLATWWCQRCAFVHELTRFIGWRGRRILKLQTGDWILLFASSKCRNARSCDRPGYGAAGQRRLQDQHDQTPSVHTGQSSRSAQQKVSVYIVHVQSHWAGPGAIQNRYIFL